MAAMYAPTALEPTRWVPGDGFQLQPAAAPYRILRRQRFDFLSSRETLIFEGCRALYRPPGAADFTWDGALRIWVQVNFGPPAGLPRRSSAFLCGATPREPPPDRPGAHGALNILPEILDRRVEEEFEVIVLDLRGGRSLPAIAEDGWHSPGVPSPFDPAGAIEVLRRLIELNALAAELGLCLAMLHPDQVMVDENLNLRIRGLPWLAPVDDRGRLPADWAAALAARATADLVWPAAAQTPPDGRLCLRWLAAFVHYLVAGRWQPTAGPLPAWLAALYQPANRRPPESWEAGLLAWLWTADEPVFPRLAPALLNATEGPRRTLQGTTAQSYCKSITTLLNASLQENNWAEVVRLATVGSAPLPAVFQAATAPEIAARLTAPPAAGFAAEPDYLALNAVLDHIARLQAALDRASHLAAQDPGAGGKRPTLLDLAATADRAPLGPPHAQPPLLPAGPPPAARWHSPFKALAEDLQPWSPAPAFQARLATWLTQVSARFTPAWVTPPLTPAEQAVLARHAPELCAAVPRLLTAERDRAAAELQAAVAACAAGGARELPRFDRALRDFLAHLAHAPADPGPAALLTAAESAVAAVEAAGRLDPALLARLLATATQATPAARGTPRIGALCRLDAALRAAQTALAAAAGEAALAGLVDLRPALDEWPQYPALQERWRQALAAVLTPALAGLEPAAATAPAQAGAAVGATPNPDPATVAGLVALLPPPVIDPSLPATVPSPPVAPDPWLGAWQPRIHAALAAWFARHSAPGGPLAARRWWQAAYGPAYARFDPPAAAAAAEQLALNLQRRRDLRTALMGNRAQAAWGKAAALWSAGETTLNDDLPADQTPGFAAGEDLGRRSLHLWLEQASQAIAQLPLPTDAAALAQFCDRLLGPLRQVAHWLAAVAAPGTPAAPPRPVSVSARDLAETIQAIEEDLYTRMLDLTERPEQFAVWEGAWAAQPLPPQSPRWQTLATAAGQLLWTDWLTARAAIADHRLEAAQPVLAGRPAEGGVARFQRIVAEPVVAAVVERWAAAWDRQQAAAARALARQDLDAALAGLAQDLVRSKDVTSRTPVMLQGVQQDLLGRLRLRDEARAAVSRRRLALDQAVAQGRLATGLTEFHALENDWQMAEWTDADWQSLRCASIRALRAGLQTQLARAEAVLAAQPAAAALPLQAVAAALEIDRDGLWPVAAAAPAPAVDPAPDPADLRPAIELRLAALYGRYLAGRADDRYGGALFAGLRTGTLPPDAPFWAALLQHHRLAAGDFHSLRQLPVGALGPEEWRHWLTTTAGLWAAREQAELPALQARVQARVEELHADDRRLAAALAQTGGAAAAVRAAALKTFIGRWRIGRQVELRRADLAALETAAQATLDRALTPPAGSWFGRAFRHWRALCAARDAAAVVAAGDEQARAEHAALVAWVWQVGAGVTLLLAALAVGAVFIWR